MTALKKILLETPEISAGIQQAKRDFEKYELAYLQRLPEIFPNEARAHLEVKIAKATPAEREKLRGELAKLSEPGAEAAKVAASAELHAAFRVVAGRLEGLRQCCEIVVYGLLIRAINDEAELAAKWNITDPKEFGGGPSRQVADLVSELARLRPQQPRHTPGTAPLPPSPKPSSNAVARWFFE